MCFLTLFIISSKTVCSLDRKTFHNVSRLIIDFLQFDLILNKYVQESFVLHTGTHTVVIGYLLLLVLQMTIQWQWCYKFKLVAPEIRYHQSSLGQHGFSQHEFAQQKFVSLHKKISIARFYTYKIQKIQCYANLFDKFFQVIF